MIEIERKFLVESDEYKALASKQYRIVQGFLNTHPERVVRVRIKGETGYLTIKGKSDVSGLSRYEWERQIPIAEAKELLQICEENTIDKIRYEVVVKGHTFEVDEFLGDNKGLVIAEVELKDQLETFSRPSWLGREVTGEVHYYNSNLIKNPYKEWEV